VKGKITDKWSYELAGNFNRTTTPTATGT